MTRLLKISIFFSTIFFAIPSSGMMEQQETYEQRMNLIKTNQSFTLDLNMDTTVKVLKIIILNRFKIPIEEQSIVAAGRDLEDTQVISEIDWDQRCPLWIVWSPQTDVQKDSKRPLMVNEKSRKNSKNEESDTASMNSATEENQQDSSLENRFTAWMLEQVEPQIDTLAELRNQFEEDLQNSAYDMARATANSVLDSTRYTTLQKDEARSWLQKLTQIESQINALNPMHIRFKNYLKSNDFVMARTIANFIINDVQCTKLQKEKARSWLQEINETESQIDPLTGIRNQFEEYLQNGVYDMARMTVNSVLDSRRYTTEQKDQARSWLQELIQVDTLTDIYTDFKNCMQARDFDMANAIVQSIVCDDQYTAQQKEKARSWLREIPRS